MGSNQHEIKVNLYKDWLDINGVFKVSFSSLES